MQVPVVAFVCLSLIGCGENGGGADDGGDPDAGGGGGDGATPDGADPVSCAGKSAQPTDATWTVAGRSVDVHVPASYDPQSPTAVVLSFHGYTGSPSGMAALTGLNAVADGAGFVAVHPEGTGTLRSWNGGACCGTAASTGIDDVGFVAAIVDQLESELCVDPARVFATGFSNGGFLSHRLGCELADRIAAIAPVSGVLGIDTCTPSRPVPVLQIHGTEDSLVPYEGNPLNDYISVDETIAGWVSRDGCTGPPAVTFQQGDATCETYSGCSGGADVALCTIAGGGHQWPGGISLPGGGHTSTDLDATAAIWEFFAAHPR
jgi:polyhydroxybutyrate depolymerase